jgi:tetratricopeptide (TPR) repeat protein
VQQVRADLPDGPFQKTAQTNDEFVLRGFLLLGEAHLAQKEYTQATEVLNTIASRQLPPQLGWQRLFTLVQVQLAQGNVPQARVGVTNLLQLAAASGSPVNQAESILLQGVIFRAANEPAAAIQLYEQNLPVLPPPQRRQAVMTLIELNQASGNDSKTIQALETLIKDYPQDPWLDQARLNLGELRLKEYYSLRQASAGKTNAQEYIQASLLSLQQAQTNLDLLATNSPRSPLIGQAQFSRGWCFLAAGKTAESVPAFKMAVDALPLSSNQVVARLKLADAYYQLRDYTNSLSQLNWIATNQDVPKLGAGGLAERAISQLVQTSAQIHDSTGVVQAADMLLSKYPQSALGDQALMLTGQYLSREGRHAEARSRFEDLTRRYTNSPLAPEALLAVARTHVREKNWPAAISNYDGWVQRHTNAALLPEVEFDRAWATYQGGMLTNALALFTNFVVRFPKHPLAPAAQNWVGVYYDNLGPDNPGLYYAEAKRNYQRVFENTNWITGELGLQASLSAARAAFLQRSYSDAATNLITTINLMNSDTNTPQSLVSTAYFMLGDTFAAMDATNKIENFGRAIIAFSKIPETDPLAPLACGRTADCHFQMAMADQSDSRYKLAAQFYAKVTTNLSANIAARSMAETGLGNVSKNLAAQAKNATEQASLLNEAFTHYSRVIRGANNLQPGEVPDPYWTARAGLEAVSILETQGRWEELVATCQRLIDMMPVLKNTLGKKLEAAKKRAG